MICLKAVIIYRLVNGVIAAFLLSLPLKCMPRSSAASYSLDWLVSARNCTRKDCIECMVDPRMQLVTVSTSLTRACTCMSHCPRVPTEAVKLICTDA